VQLSLHIALRSSVAKPQVLANADDAQGEPAMERAAPVAAMMAAISSSAAGRAEPTEPDRRNAAIARALWGCAVALEVHWRPASAVGHERAARKGAADSGSRRSPHRRRCYSHVLLVHVR
jgi:hypothetical protein